MKKLAIIGASYLQRPLVEKALEMNVESHVFAWKEGCVVDGIADFYYPISIRDKSKILEICKQINIDGITSIASDIAMPTVNYVAEQLGLIGNSRSATVKTTDKFVMRTALRKAGLSCPNCLVYDEANFPEDRMINYPVVVKPNDRSGSRGVQVVKKPGKVNMAIEKALSYSLSGRAIVEEFIKGKEYSVEMISYQGEHHLLAVTDKVTTGPPHFVELEHHQPADISTGMERKMAVEVIQALNILGLENGASHSEIFVTPNDEVIIGEIAGRMGGDLIGSDLVPYSTGYDFLKAVIEIALGEFKTGFPSVLMKEFSGAYFVSANPGIVTDIINRSGEYKEVVKAIPIVKRGQSVDGIIENSANRAGVIVYKSPDHRVPLCPSSVLKFITRKN